MIDSYAAMRSDLKSAHNLAECREECSINSRIVCCIELQALGCHWLREDVLLLA